MRDHVSFFLNGQPVSASGAAACGMLAPFLRNVRSLTGTKIACSQGACGSCSILLGRPRNGAIEYAPVNSCIFPVFNCDGCHIITVEGVGGPHDGIGQTGTSGGAQLTAVQEAMVGCHAAQCGFCTPGIVISLTALRESSAVNAEDGDSSQNPAQADVAAALEGNLCRCTGYSAILDAGAHMQTLSGPRLAQLYPPAPLLAQLQTNAAGPFELTGTEDVATTHVFAPRSLAKALAWKAAHPTTTVVSGGTETGVAINTEEARPREVLSLTHIEELGEIRVEEGTLVLGAGACWAEVAAFANAALPELAYLMTRWGSPQLRQAGTVGGNIVRAAPISDSLPLLLVTEAELEFASQAGTRRVPVADFLRDRLNKTPDGADLKTDELLRRVLIPLPASGQTLRLYKVSKRRAFDRSIVSAAFLLDLQGETIQSIRIAYGGAAPSALRPPRTEAFLRGKSPSAALWKEAAQIAMTEVAPVSTATAGAEYRRQLVGNLLRKFGRETAGTAVAGGAR